ncbi:MAG TPA: AbrB/MazE/SpoVT family DNA-binding domain-containing protein [Rhizomicrobium sp.]|jgi:AbrB family looped-hinge helix DNA binding protein
MSKLTVTAKGQVTLRKELLQHLGIRPGDAVAVDKLPDGVIEIRAAHQTGRISDAFDMFKSKRRLSIEDIKRITEEAWAGKR